MLHCLTYLIHVKYAKHVQLSGRDPQLVPLFADHVTNSASSLVPLDLVFEFK